MSLTLGWVQAEPASGVADGDGVGDSALRGEGAGAGAATARARARSSALTGTAAAVAATGERDVESLRGVLLTLHRLLVLESDNQVQPSWYFAYYYYRNNPHRRFQGITCHFQVPGIVPR